MVILGTFMTFAQTLGTTFKRSISLLVSIALLIVILSSVAHTIDPKKIGNVLLSINIFWVCAAFILTCITILINSYRFAIISQSVLGQRASYRQAIKITWLSSFVALSTPFAAMGDIARAGLVKWLMKTSIMNSVQVVLFDRGFSLYCLIVLTLVSSLGCYQYFNQSWLWYAQILIPIASLLLVVFTLIVYPLVKWPDNKFCRFMTETFNILSHLMKQPRYLLWQIVISLGNIAVYVGTFIIFSYAFHFSFNIINLFLFEPLILIINNLPFFYLGWGGREAAFLLLMPILAPKVNSDMILAASLGYGVITMLAGLVGGFYLLGTHKR
jgi:uncharacterized membrane protein YbhN (UPF0104 family)